MWIERLHELKKRSGMTNESIAQESGVPIKTVDKIFSGAIADPKLYIMQQIVYSMGYDLDDLLNPDQVTEGIPGRLKEVLREKKMRPADLAQAANVDEQMIYEILSGKIEPTGRYLVAIVNALGITLDWLLDTDFQEEAAVYLELKSYVEDLRKKPELRDAIRILRSLAKGDIEQVCRFAESLSQKA